MFNAVMMSAMRDEMMKAAGLPPEILAKLHGVADALAIGERVGKPAAAAATAAGKKAVQGKSILGGGVPHPAIGGGQLHPSAVDWGGF